MVDYLKNEHGRKRKSWLRNVPFAFEAARKDRQSLADSQGSQQKLPRKEAADAPSIASFWDAATSLFLLVLYLANSLQQTLAGRTTPLPVAPDSGEGGNRPDRRRGRAKWEPTVVCVSSFERLAKNRLGHPREIQTTISWRETDSHRAETLWRATERRCECGLKKGASDATQSSRPTMEASIGCVVRPHCSCKRCPHPLACPGCCCTSALLPCSLPTMRMCNDPHWLQWWTGHRHPEIAAFSPLVFQDGGVAALSPERTQHQKLVAR